MAEESVNNTDDLLNLLDGPKRPEPQPFTPRTAPLDDQARRYALAALAGEIANFTSVPVHSGRNHALNVAAFKMGGYIAAGAIDEHTVIEALGAADGGLDYKATRDTIASGIAAGMASPKNIPEPRNASWALTSSSNSANTGGAISDDPFNAFFAPPEATSSASPGEAKFDGPPEFSTSPNSGADAGTHINGATSATLADKVHAALPIIDWSILWQGDAEVEWISYPLLPARRLVVIYSPPKVGKSLLLLELAAAVCQGLKHLGYTPDRPRRVLYVDFENDPQADIRPRLVNMGYGPDDLIELKYLSFPTLSALDSEQGAAELVAACQVYGVEAVIIDTVSRAVEGEENNNDTWIRFYRHAGLALKRIQVALIRLDHTGKDETKGQRGGSAKGGDVDAVWRMSRLTDGSDGRPETFRLICEMKRFPLPAADMILTLERHENPLRHLVRATGARDNIVHAVIAFMDSEQLAFTKGYSPDLLAEVKERVNGATKRTVEEAVRLRKLRISDTDES